MGVATDPQITDILSTRALTRAALETPVGVHDLHATGYGTHGARVGANREFNVVFH